MAAYKFKIVNGYVWGRMPSGIAVKFETEEDYRKAYRAEEDEIADEMARLDAERQEYLRTYDPYEWLQYA